MAAQPIVAPKETKYLRTTADERNSMWVLFPNGRQYMLPIVARGQKISPVFDDDGNMTVMVSKLDPEVDAFFDIVATIKDEQIVIQTAAALSAFFALLRKLLLTNNDLPNDEMRAILTMTNIQMGNLFNAILAHVVKQ